MNSGEGEDAGDGGVPPKSEVRAEALDCREGCGACCIAPSITSPIPGMPHGKPAGVPCVQLLPDMRCAIFGRPERPAFCASLRPTREMCGATREEALDHLGRLEAETDPSGPSPRAREELRARTPRVGCAAYDEDGAGGAERA